jgi:polyphosphate kinase
LHAIDKAVRSLSDSEGKRWAEVISRKLVDSGIEVDDEEALSENSETHAQLIFQNPLERMLTALQQESADD